MTTTPDTTNEWVAPLRKSDLTGMVQVLRDRNAMRHDIVVPARDLGFVGNDLLIKEQAHTLTEDGVTTTDTLRSYTVGNVATEHLTERLGIPITYWRRMANEEPGLLATNANTWLRKDDRTFYVRSYLPESGEGFLRAVLSDRYARIDNLDVLAAALQGVHAAGLDTGSMGISCDLSERRMYVRIEAPQVGINVADVLGTYRDPRSGTSVMDKPMMWAGLVITNSEVGNGAFSIAPRVVLQVCTNGMTRQQDVSRRAHLGAQRAVSADVDTSAETERRLLALVESQTTDAVRTFLSVDYLRRTMDDLAALTGVRLTAPEQQVKDVTRALRYSEVEADAVFAHFIAGGDLSPLGVGHAITALAQDVTDPDRAADMEADFWRAAELALASTR